MQFLYSSALNFSDIWNPAEGFIFILLRDNVFGETVEIIDESIASNISSRNG